VFGLGSAGYYVGRSAYETLPMTFSAWIFALALLAIVATRQLGCSPKRLPGVPQLAVIFGVAVAACTLGQTPLPWNQVKRLHQPSVRGAPRDSTPFAASALQGPRRFISATADGPRRFVVERGMPIALFLTMGHRFADAYGIRDVVPYTGLESIQTPRQFDVALDALRDAGGNTVVIPSEAIPEMLAALARRGFEVVTPTGLRAWRKTDPPEVALTESGFTKWVDTRHLHPRALSGG